MTDGNQMNYGPPPPSGGSNVKIAILFGAVIALLAANVYLFLQMDKMRTDMGKIKDAILSEVANVRDSHQMTVQTQRKNIDALKDELETARRQASLAAGQAKIDAEKRVDEVSKRLETAEKKAQAQVAQVAKAVSEVKEDQAAAATKIGEVSSEVSNVKTEVATAKSEIDKTIADLKRVTGDLGVQSGLIATNARELAALKAMGDRNYFEFNLTKTKQPVKVGDITMQLKRTDMKKNKYTVDVVADDKRVEKKDRNINEPVQFYTAKARQPYEIVVNEVKKDIIVGYLSTPKVTASR
jgi:chromosome segregation ATPase